MRFLIDADLPRSTKILLENFGHEALDVRDIGLKSAKDPVIACYAKDHQACLLTGDFGFADIRNYPPENYYGIVVLGLPRDATAAFILQLISRRFYARRKCSLGYPISWPSSKPVVSA